jgi:hypothetical protein
MRSKASVGSSQGLYQDDFAIQRAREIETNTERVALESSVMRNCEAHAAVDIGETHAIDESHTS